MEICQVRHLKFMRPMTSPAASPIVQMVSLTATLRCVFNPKVMHPTSLSSVACITQD